MKTLLFGITSLLLALPAACGSTPATGEDAATADGTIPADAVVQPDAAVQPDGAVETGPTGFIGSPCDTVADCTYADAVCLTDGFPNGTCSQACDLYCPDEDGHPTTFCVAAGELPPAGAALGDGACLSRCDFGFFPDTGCRPDYGCVAAARANEPGTVTYSCLPGEETDLTQCQLDLAARGVSFEPTVIPDEHPSTHPNLTCHIEDPVYVNSPIHDVELRTSGGSPSARILASCIMAHAVVDTIDDVKPFGVVALRHMGTYNCRVIAGTSTLSEHSFATAIDIAGFDFDDATLYTVFDDWEHDTANPVTPGGIFLYEAAHRWFDGYYWNIILTPNYNVDHDDHFHVDMTPGSHFLGFTDGRYIGPAPYAD
ncbi:MAG: extensin family protein [bacterium]